MLNEELKLALSTFRGLNDPRQAYGLLLGIEEDLVSSIDISSSKNLKMNKQVTLQKNCIATIIPAGDEVTLAEGATFTIAQSLGGSVTLRDPTGMYRVGESQLDALGEVKQAVLDTKEPIRESDGPFDEDQVWQAMRDVMIRKYQSIS